MTRRALRKFILELGSEKVSKISTYTNHVSKVLNDVSDHEQHFAHLLVFVLGLLSHYVI